MKAIIAMNNLGIDSAFYYIQDIYCHEYNRYLQNREPKEWQAVHR